MKLYWRVKKNGRWTWQAAVAYPEWTEEQQAALMTLMEEEE